MTGIHPGAVIVLHDCRKWVLETLRILGARFKEKGYTSLNLSELFSAAFNEVQVDDSNISVLV